MNKDQNSKNPLLQELGQRLRLLRLRTGLTRRRLAKAAGISERYLANLEYGEGNASILVLTELAAALNCTTAELIGDTTTRCPEWLMIRSALENADDATLRQTYHLIRQQILPESPQQSGQRIALIGLRGAGKSTLGRMLAETLDYPFIELSQLIEQMAGITLAEINDMYGNAAYRRYELRALENCLQHHSQAILAIPGGLVANPVNFNLLLSRSTSIWLQAKPTEHMQRVRAQGDLRPMAESKEAMNDLRAILESRTPFYSKADYHFDTSGQSIAANYERLHTLVRNILHKAII